MITITEIQKNLREAILTSNISKKEQVTLRDQQPMNGSGQHRYARAVRRTYSQA